MRHLRALPLVLFLILVPFTPEIDLGLSRLFYSPSPSGKGHFVDNGLTRFFYNYGEWPAFILWGLALLTLLFSSFCSFLKKWRRGAMALVLTLILGSGLIVNAFFKEYWHRPRPKQIEEFGGRYAFRPMYLPHFSLKKQKDEQKSFPSGHVTMGFYFFSLILVGRRYKSRPLYYSGVGLVLFWGIGLTIVRIMQGGHFFSDTLAAALIMWETAFFIDKLVFKRDVLHGKGVDFFPE